VLANETFYSALIIAIFIFSDATPELTIKIGAAIVLIVSVNGMIFANFVMVIVSVWKGRDTLKEEIKQAKMRRAEKELREEEEEEERRQRQLKEEEEFTKLPDEATDLNEAEFDSEDEDKAGAEVDDDEKSKKRKKKRKNKKKVQDEDMLAEYGTGETAGNTTQGLMNATDMPLKEEGKKKKKKKSKRKGANTDQLADANLAATDLGEGDVDLNDAEANTKTDKGAKTKAGTDENSGSSSSDKKKKG